MKLLEHERFSLKIHELQAKKYPRSGDIGIELEIEGKNLQFDLPSNYWVFHPEASLREGVEYVLTEPIPIKLLDEALAEFKKVAPKMKIIHSLRTSTHVHVNVSSLTLAQLYHVLCHYFLVEDLLVGLNGSSRVGNLFCLRASDAFGQISSCISGLRSNSYPSGDNNTLKYGAVNLLAPRKYGSLEFRFPRGAESMEFVKFWAAGLYNHVQITKNYDIRETLDTIDYQNLSAILTKTLPEDLVKAVKDNYTIQEIRSSISNAIKRVTCIATVMDQESFATPNIRFRGDDLDTSNVMSRDLRFPDKVEISPRKEKMKVTPEPFEIALDDEPVNLFFDEDEEP